MEEIYEILAGTSFLAPVIVVLISFLNTSPEHILPVLAVLALPVGWLVVNFQRFIFTFRGRYERYPMLEHVRDHVNVTRIEDKYMVQLKGFSLNQRARAMVRLHDHSSQNDQCQR